MRVCERERKRGRSKNTREEFFRFAEFSVLLPCTGNSSGIAQFGIGLMIETRKGKPLNGTPLLLSLRKECTVRGECVSLSRLSTIATPPRPPPRPSICAYGFAPAVKFIAQFPSACSSSQGGEETGKIEKETVSESQPWCAHARFNTPFCPTEKERKRERRSARERERRERSVFAKSGSHMAHVPTASSFSLNR